MTRILISGAGGKMGRFVADCIAKRNDCEVAAGIDLCEVQADFPVYRSFAELDVKADALIDFSHPSLLDSLLDYAKAHALPVVLATTGYSEEQIAKIKQAATEIPVFFSFNMSLGINLLCALAKMAVKVLGDAFDIEIIEKHHNQKLDAPSGTALMLADQINLAADNRYTYRYDRSTLRQKRDAKEIGLHAVRGGTIVGEHDVLFAGRDEVITLSHCAASKEVFAVGAVRAALFLAGCEKGLYDMNDMIAKQED